MKNAGNPIIQTIESFNGTVLSNELKFSTQIDIGKVHLHDKFFLYNSNSLLLKLN